MSFQNLNISNKKKLFIAAFLSVIFLIIIFLTALLSKNCCFCGDDFNYGNYYTGEKLFDCLIGSSRLQHGGYYIGMFLCKFISFYLPNKLGIHPSDFIGLGEGVFKGIFIALISLLLSKFLTFFKKQQFVQISALIFTAAYLFFYAQNTQVIVVNYQFYRYVFSLLFFSIFIFYVGKTAISPTTNFKNNHIFFVALCGFILGTSIEMLFSIVFLFSFCLIGWNIICLAAEKIFKYKISNSLKFNLAKNFYIPFAAMISGVVLFTSTPGFNSVLQNRTLSNISINTASLYEYLSLYFQVCVKDIFPQIILMISSFGAAMYFAVKKSEIKQVVFPVFLILSTFIFMLSLYFCGKAFDEFTRDRYYLEHYNLIFLFKMVILYPIFILVSYNIKNIKYPKKSKAAALTTCVILLILAGYYAVDVIKNYNSSSTNTEMYELKMNYYKSEKMLRYYISKGQIPVIPKFPIVPDFVKEDYKINYCTQEAENCENLKCYNSHVLTSSYYPKIYKDTSKSFCTSDNAEEIFYKNGGIFSEEELKHIKFKRLFNKNFVLNNEL